MIPPIPHTFVAMNVAFKPRGNAKAPWKANKANIPCPDYPPGLGEFFYWYHMLLSLEASYMAGNSSKELSYNEQMYERHLFMISPYAWVPSLV